MYFYDTLLHFEVKVEFGNTKQDTLEKRTLVRIIQNTRIFFILSE